ncbi:hypothetical protein HAX54_024012, partial [Datura stramonium]|nr:hypothetical protein [Datura stramonium]
MKHRDVVLAPLPQLDIDHPQSLYPSRDIHLKQYLKKVSQPVLYLYIIPPHPQKGVQAAVM